MFCTNKIRNTKTNKKGNCGSTLNEKKPARILHRSIKDSDEGEIKQYPGVEYLLHRWPADRSILC